MLKKEEFAAMQDHTCICNYVSKETVAKFCKDAIEYGFACLYVNQADIAMAKAIVGDKVHIGCPVGFPYGTNTTETKIFEGLNAIDNGASELDIVINVNKLKDGDHKYVSDELKAFVKAVKEKKPDVIVKAIIECYYLTREEKIIACNIVADSGADYVKQATGTTPDSFFVGDIKLMNSAVGDRIKIKSAGHIVNLEDAVGTIAFGASRVGNDMAVRWMQEWDDCRWSDEIKTLK
ncbi:MAG: deoxyribose-phosphate aldolase [Ruminiclostridium sp.]